jgi:hypothetical protein
MHDYRPLHASMRSRGIRTSLYSTKARRPPGMAGGTTPRMEEVGRRREQTPRAVQAASGFLPSRGIRTSVCIRAVAGMGESGLDSRTESRAMQQGCCGFGLGPIGESATAPSLARGPRLDPIGEGHGGFGLADFCAFGCRSPSTGRHFGARQFLNRLIFSAKKSAQLLLLTVRVRPSPDGVPVRGKARQGWWGGARGSAAPTCWLKKRWRNKGVDRNVDRDIRIDHRGRQETR